MSFHKPASSDALICFPILPLRTINFNRETNYKFKLNLVALRSLASKDSCIRVKNALMGYGIRFSTILHKTVCCCIGSTTDFGWATIS